MEKENNDLPGNWWGLSFVLGGVVGAMAALLFSPWEGRKTRTRIKELAVEVKDKTNQLSENWKQKCTNFLGKNSGIQGKILEIRAAGPSGDQDEAGIEKKISTPPEWA